MDFKYKKGEKLKFLFNHGDGVGTCYTPGETVTVLENATDDFIVVVGEIHQTNQTVHSCQVERISNSFNLPISDANGGFKIGDYILVEQPVKVSKIAKIAKITGFSTSQERNTIYAYLTCISSLKELKTNWFTCISGNRTTTSPLDKNQIHWLDYCIEQNRYVAYEDIPKLSKETPSVAFPSSGWCSTADKEIGYYLAKKFDAPYIPPGNEGYAWSYSSYWKIDVASGKPHWNKEFLKKIIKQETLEKDVEKVRGTPSLKFKKGDTVKICKTRFEEPTMHKFKLGTIVIITRAEPIDTLQYRCCLLNGSDAWWVAEEDLEKYQEDTLKISSVKKGDIATVIATPGVHSHRFNIGEVVECIELGPGQNRFVSKERPESKWWLYSSEYKLTSQDFGKPLITGTGSKLDGTKSNPFLVDEMGQREKYIAGIDSIDGWRSPPHIWLQDPTTRVSEHIPSSEWMHDLHTTDHVDLVAPEGEVPKNTIFGKLKSFLHLEVKPEIELKDRTVKPVEVKSKIKNIDNGLIVPLEPIKNRIIK